MLSHHYPNRVAAMISYNEGIAHQIYAGSDFILMPSRVEPCGLNQLYAMKYGTIPLVHDIGGLKDSVIYFDGENGTGLKFKSLDFYTIFEELNKAVYLFNKKELLDKIRQNANEMDYSWTLSAKKYKAIYDSFV
jgi:starch synthase